MFVNPTEGLNYSITEGARMTLIIRCWKKALYFMITGATSLFIAACYGMPAGFSNLGVWSVKVRGQSNEPIKGLEVTTLRFVGGSTKPDTLEVQQTDSLGVASSMLTSDGRDSDYRYEARIKDLDGAANGGSFSDTLVVWENTHETIVQMRKEK